MAAVIISSCSLFTYRLPLSRELTLKQESLIEREGLLLRLVDVSGHIGWGEIAPLPGFSSESLTEAKAQATTLAGSLVRRDLPETIFDLRRSMGRHGGSLLPSVRCGFEAAALHLAAEREQRAISFTPNPHDKSSVPLNALLSGDEADILEKATLLVSQGYRAVKLKVGRQSLEADIALTYRLHARLNGRATLRLDANRAWSFDQAMEFAKAVEILPLEYVEEPLMDPSGLAELAKAWKLPLALDESLIDLPPEKLYHFVGLKALILKPMLLGGFVAALDWAKWGRRRDLISMVSSSFESSVGLMLLGHFAAQLSPDIPCGLDTSDWFVENLLERPLPTQSGSLQLDRTVTLPDGILLDKLTEVKRG
ncbi:MAG: o-succinylbenzoate synthase [bacterium]|nr:o-succinylbenzoate synthase [bacterium]